MEELFSSAAPQAQKIVSLIGAFLMLGGLICLPLLVRQYRKNHPGNALLTERLHARSWTPTQVGILLSSALLLYALASFTGLFFYEEQIPWVQLIVMLAVYALVATVVVHINRYRGASWSSGYGLGARNLKWLLAAPICYLVLLPPIALLGKGWQLLLEHGFQVEIELQEVAQMMLGELTPLQLAYMATAILLAPFYEELLFRGILFPFLAKRIGLRRAIAAVSVLFAVIHFSVPHLVPLFLLSAALCIAYYRTGSLWISIGMHITFNAVSILLLNILG